MLKAPQLVLGQVQLYGLAAARVDPRHMLKAPVDPVKSDQAEVDLRLRRVQLVRLILLLRRHLLQSRAVGADQLLLALVGLRMVSVRGFRGDCLFEVDA